MLPDKCCLVCYGQVKMLSLYTRISSNKTDELSHRFALLHDVIWFLLSD